MSSQHQVSIAKYNNIIEYQLLYIQYRYQVVIAGYDNNINYQMEDIITAQSISW